MENKNHHSFKDMGQSLASGYGITTDKGYAATIEELSEGRSILSVLCHISKQLEALQDTMKYRRDIDCLAMQRVNKRFDALSKEHRNCYKKNKEAIEQAAVMLEKKHGKDKTVELCKAIRSRKFKNTSPQHDLNREGYLLEVEPHELKKGYYTPKTPEWFLNHFIWLLDHGEFP